MKKLALAIFLALFAMPAMAQTTIAITGGQAVIPAQTLSVTVNGTAVPITIPSQTVPVTGSVVVPASSGGTTYTAGPGIAVNGTVISINVPDVIMPATAFTSGVHTLASTDMMKENVLQQTAPSVIALPTPSTVSSGGTAVGFKNEGALITFTGAPSDTPAALHAGQALWFSIDTAGAWHVDRGAGQ